MATQDSSVNLDEIRRLAREARLQTLRDLLAVAGVTVSAFVFASALELNERINRWTENWEFVQADELRTTLLALAVALGWFSWRRWVELRRELAMRVVLEADLARSLDDNRSLSRRSIELQERERKEVARELHDELGQYLNAIEIEAVGLRSSLAEGSPAADSLERIRHLARHVYGVARTLMHRMRPVGLDEFGLEEALQHLVDGWQQQKPEVNYTLVVDADLPPLPEDLNIAVFRMVQESLTNIARHSGARNASIRLHGAAPDALYLRIQDDGRGVPDDVRVGLGLTGMRERAELLHGSMTLSTVSGGAGTVLEFRLPRAAVAVSAV